MDLEKELNGIEPNPDENEAAPMPEEAEAEVAPATEEENENENENGENEVVLTAEELAGIPITPQDDEEEPEDEAELCILCEEKPADKSFGEDYDLCADCRKRLIKSPFRFSGILALLVVICIGVFSTILLTNQTETLVAVVAGDEAYASNNLLTAMQSYAQAGNIGWKTAKKLVKAYDKSGYMSGISNVVDAFFYDATELGEDEAMTYSFKAGKVNINSPWNKDVKAIRDDYDNAMDAYEKYYAFISEYDQKVYYGEISVDEIPYDEVIGKIDAALAEDNTKHGIALANYCKYYIAAMCGEDQQVQQEFINTVEKAAPEYEWLYINTATELAIRSGDYEKAQAYCERINEINAEDVYGTHYQAVIKRYQGDCKGALAITEDLIDHYEDNGFAQAFYEGAIEAFLLGDYEKAEEYAGACYEGEYLNEQTANLYALICKVTGDEEGYKGVVDMLKDYDLEISPTVQEYVDGKLTAEELFNEREVPFK